MTGRTGGSPERGRGETSAEPPEDAGGGGAPPSGSIDAPSEPDADAALLLRARAGDRSAFAGLYDRYATPAYSLAVRLVGEARAQDVVHDAFLFILEKGSTFDPLRGSFRGWFMTSVHHRCLNLIRKNRASAGDALLSSARDGSPDPVEAAIRRLEDEHVRAALERLPEDQRRLLVLSYYLGFTQTALSARLGLPLGTVKARMRRGLLALRELLGEEIGRKGA